MPASACSEVDDAASWLLAGIGAAFNAIRGSSHSSAGSDRGGLRGCTSSRHGTFLPRVFSKAVPTIVSDMCGRTTGLVVPVPISMIGSASGDLESYEKKISLQNAATGSSHSDLISRSISCVLSPGCGSRAELAARHIDSTSESKTRTRFQLDSFSRTNCWCAAET